MNKYHYGPEFIAREIIYEDEEGFGSVYEHYQALVRCRDCKYFERNKGNGLCYMHYEKDGDFVACVNPNDYCSHGKKKE